ncbi:hypothetical protein GALMADRAFT_250306 [Galerina marginata CBS 339.88]|uniref:F-box domain-containing protein n=1 Tax=Galerina marginata (strain CBS 339.88) TaxID=685588 RepID=A0A067STY6_GALM3|nr:hypothetical protein GALMADRAFT_250306 [Galerina marginata CBS 339.88]
MMNSSATIFTQQKFSLNNDLLWRILDINANMYHKSEEEIPALTTLRLTSQVSASWRELAISAASLWGSVINLNHLNQKKGHWRDEVLKRSKLSLLCVKGKTGSSLQSAEFFASILTDHWHRIRILDLEKSGNIEYIGVQVLITLFSRSAPFLENFTVPTLYSRPGSAPLIDDAFRIFSDNAPFLRNFKHFTVMPSHIHAPWMSQLRRLVLIQPISAHKFIGALSSMSLLESLTATCHLIKDSRMNPLPVVTVSRLNQLYFNCNLATSTEWIHILSKITPATDCSLRFVFHLSNREAQLTATDMALAMSLLSNYSQRHFNTCKALSVGLLIKPTSIILLDTEKIAFSKDDVGLDRFEFSLSQSSPFPSRASPSVLESIGQCHWNSVETLKLSIEDPIGPSDINFIKFVSSLISLTSLTVWPRTLQLLSRIPTHLVSTLFPCLQDLCYITEEAQQSDSVILKPFLKLRKKVGRPISVLYLGGDYIQNQDFRFLDVYHDLTVVWWFYDEWQERDQRMEYRCGSGKPGVLDFASKKR